MAYIPTNELNRKPQSFFGGLWNLVTEGSWYDDDPRDNFSLLNPGDWFGGHSETSMWKSEHENQRIAAEEAQLWGDLQRAKTKKQADVTKKSEIQSDFLDQLFKMQDRIAERERESQRARDMFYKNMAATQKRSERQMDIFNRFLRRQETRETKRQKTEEMRRGEALNTIDKIISQTDDLISDIEASPSSAHQASKMAYDRQLQNEAAAAGLRGRSFAESPEEAFSDNLATADANLLTNTAVALRDENMQRKSQIQGLLGMKGSLASEGYRISQGEGDQYGKYLPLMENMLSGQHNRNLSGASFAENILGGGLDRQFRGASYLQGRDDVAWNRAFNEARAQDSATLSVLNLIASLFGADSGSGGGSSSSLKAAMGA